MRYRTLPLLLLLAVLSIVAYRLYTGDLLTLFRTPSLEIDPAAARRQRFTLILDLRTPRDRETLGFYPNSIPVDPSRLLEEVPYLLGHRYPGPTPLLVYSAEGDGRAQTATQRLYESGFTGARFLKGSYVDMLPPGPQ